VTTTAILQANYFCPGVEKNMPRKNKKKKKKKGLLCVKNRLQWGLGEGGAGKKTPEPQVEKERPSS